MDMSGSMKKLTRAGLVQTASESEIEDDVDPHASKTRPRLQSVPTNNEWKEDVVRHLDLNFVEDVCSKLQMDQLQSR